MKNNYVYKWILQRVTAFLLIPLTFWFIYQCISFQNIRYNQLSSFFNSYLNSFLFLLMMSAMLIHAKIGCETIIQDYVSTYSLKNIFKYIINIITFSLLLMVFFAIIRLNTI